MLGQNVHVYEAKRPGGKTSAWGELSRGRNVQEPNRPEGETSRQGAKRP